MDIEKELIKDAETILEMLSLDDKKKVEYLIHSRCKQEKQKYDRDNQKYDRDNGIAKLLAFLIALLIGVTVIGTFPCKKAHKEEIDWADCSTFDKRYVSDLTLEAKMTCSQAGFEKFSFNLVDGWVCYAVDDGTLFCKEIQSFPSFN